MCVSRGAEVLQRLHRNAGIYRQDAFKSSTKEKILKIKKILIQHKEKVFYFKYLRTSRARRNWEKKIKIFNFFTKNFLMRQTKFVWVTLFGNTVLLVTFLMRQTEMRQILVTVSAPPRRIKTYVQLIDFIIKSRFLNVRFLSY